MPAIFTQNSGLTIEQPRPLGIATNNFCHSLCIGSGDDLWVSSTGWDGVTQSPPYSGTSKIQRFNRKNGSALAAISVGPYWQSGNFLHGVLGIACAHGLVVAADIQDGKAIVVDPTNNTILKRAMVGAAPRDVAADADGFWVTVSGDGKIVKLDDAGNIVSGSEITFASGSIPYRMHFADDGYLYVADAGLNCVHKIDTDAFQIVTYYSAGTGPWGCRVKDGLLLCANVGSNDVTLIDLPTSDTETIPLTSGDGAHDCEILESQSGGHVFGVVCSGSNKIKWFDASGSLLHTINVQTDPAVMRHDGEYLYNTNAISNVVTATRIEGAV